MTKVRSTQASISINSYTNLSKREFSQVCIVEMFFVNNVQRLNIYDEDILCFRSSHRRCSVKKMFSEISLNSQENACVSLFLNKVAGPRQNF